MQGVWIEACRSLAEMAAAMGDAAMAAKARDEVERTRLATEKTYWLEGRGYYVFATAPPGRTAAGGARPYRAPPGAAGGGREGRPADETRSCPRCRGGTLDEARAQSEIDHFGVVAFATDWG
jgi:hypothetical protein